MTIYWGTYTVGILLDRDFLFLASVFWKKKHKFCTYIAKFCENYFLCKKIITKSSKFIKNKKKINPIMVKTREDISLQTLFTGHKKYISIEQKLYFQSSRESSVAMCPIYKGPCYNRVIKRYLITIASIYIFSVVPSNHL